MANLKPFTSTAKRVLLWGVLALVILTLVGLGSWQIQRQFWKTALIAQVDERVHARPRPVPSFNQWSGINMANSAYLRVTASGVLLYQYARGVQAVTVHGPGFWLIIPLRQIDGTFVYVNRGFVEHLPDLRQLLSADQGTTVTVTGLLRLNEPQGGFLRKNDPATQRWYSRDVVEMAKIDRLAPSAPFFVDMQSIQLSNDLLTPFAADPPVMGLTVIQFSNNHLIYALTWYTLAALLVYGCFHVSRSKKAIESA